MAEAMTLATRFHDGAWRAGRLPAGGFVDAATQAPFDALTSLALTQCQDGAALLIVATDQEPAWVLSAQGREAETLSCPSPWLQKVADIASTLEESIDARSDPRWLGHPWFDGAHAWRDVSLASVRASDGTSMGVFCVMDRHTRTTEPDQRDALRQLASLAAHLLARENDHLELQRRRMEDANRQHEILVASRAAGLDLKAFLDTGYVYRYVNSTYQDYWGVRPEQIVGMHVAELAGEVVFQDTVKPLLDRALAGEIVSFEFVMDFPAKGKRHIELHYLPVCNDQGQIAGVVVRGHDVSVLRQQQEQLRETVALLEHKSLEQQRFIHIISHDLKEPVNTINNFSGLLRDDFSGHLPSHARRYLDFVHAGGRRMKVLLDDLTDLLLLDKHRLSVEPTDLNALAQQAIEDLTSAIDRSAGQVLIDSPLPKVTSDPTLLRIVLQNLIANGLKFVPPGTSPRVQLSSRRDGDWERVSVSDNGIGIPPDKHADIFDMFQRLHNRKEYEGTGLGLSICRRILELHGGRIEVQSTPGSGSCFTLLLPVREQDNP